jgi:multiple sugar transport system ATP-binding protein
MTSQRHCVAGFGAVPDEPRQGALHGQNGASFQGSAGSGVIEVDLGDRKAAAGYVGKEVILGVRPENCDLLWSGQPSSNNCFEAVVDIVEPMGAETYFHLQTGAHTIISRSPFGAQQADAGHRFKFQISATAAHLFDPVTTHRIVDSPAETPLVGKSPRNDDMSSQS